MRKAVSEFHDHLFYLDCPLALDHFKPHPDAEFIDLSPNGCQATLLDRFWKMIDADKNLLSVRTASHLQTPKRIEVSFNAKQAEHQGSQNVFAEPPKVGWPAFG